jgi:hypothetical protein
MFEPSDEVDAIIVSMSGNPEDWELDSDVFRHKSGLVITVDDPTMISPYCSDWGFIDRWHMRKAVKQLLRYNVRVTLRGY